MPVIHNGVEAYREDQLLAERRDAGLVQEGLRRLGIAASELESSTLLSLTLLDMSGVESAAAVLRMDSALVESASRAQQSRGQTAAGITDMDLVLFAFRRSMREAHDGWVPTVGKNRILDRVQGSPYIKGGVGAPSRAEP